MKTYLLAILVTAFAVSCGHSAKNKINANEAKTVASGDGQKLVVDTAASTINWVGRKVGGAHHGTLAIQSGKLVINGTQLVSGDFVLDMSNIVDHDLTDSNMNAMLIHHLKSADFFDVATYPFGYFSITKVEDLKTDSTTHRITGNLKIKAIEKSISFNAKITKEGDVYKAVSVPFEIDRTQWGINYGSKNIFKNLTDKIIDDDIELQITIVAKDQK